MKKKSNFKSLSGHSLLELMTSLAIMGVLSISVLFGYKAVMVRHQANQILDDTMILFTQVIGSEMPFGKKMSPQFVTASDKNMEGWRDAETEGYAVKVWSISFPVCERILQMDALIIKDVSHQGVAVDECMNDVEMTFAYFPIYPKTPEDTAVDTCDWGKKCCKDGYRFRWWGRWYCRRHWVPWWLR